MNYTPKLLTHELHTKTYSCVQKCDICYSKKPLHYTLVTHNPAPEKGDNSAYDRRNNRRLSQNNQRSICFTWSLQSFKPNNIGLSAMTQIFSLSDSSSLNAMFISSTSFSSNLIRLCLGIVRLRKWPS